MRDALGGITNAIDLQLYVCQTQSVPNIAQHLNLLGFHIGAHVAHSLYAALVKLSVPAFLRTLVPKHGTHSPHALWVVIRPAMLNRTANHTRRAFWAQR